MKKNYNILAFTFIINLFMALSLNSFSSTSIYLPLIFLYFLSNLAAFLEKKSYYKNADLHCEQKISFLCFCACLLAVCLYIANSINCIEIRFQQDQGIYRILMQGIQSSFFTFNAIDITPFTFFFVFTMPFAYLLLWIIPYLREYGFTKSLMIKTSRDHIKVLLLLIAASIGLGILGILLCHLKYYSCSRSFGLPQYFKYFSVFSFTGLTASYFLFLLHYKKK